MSTFSKAKSFNSDFNNWDVSNVTSTRAMFTSDYKTSVFSQDLSDWDVSNVTEMKTMFLSATIFNQDLSGWCAANILTEPSSFFDYSALPNKHQPDWGASCP